MKTVIFHRGIAKKSALIVPIALILIATGLVSTPYQAATNDLPLFEGLPLAPGPEAEYIPGQIIVKFKEGVLSAAEASLTQNLGTSVVHTSPRGGFKVLKSPQGGPWLRWLIFTQGKLL